MWTLSVKVFRSVRYPGDWELNVIGRRWNLRIGRSQVALWRDYRPIVNWCRRLERTPLQPTDA